MAMEEEEVEEVWAEEKEVWEEEKEVWAELVSQAHPFQAGTLLSPANFF